MARDLMTQAQQRQERMQIEREQDVEYGKRITKQVQEMEKREKRYAKSVRSKHAKNREELSKQVKLSFND